MANIRTVQLQRMSTSQPWGFRLQGGCDFCLPLSVKKTTLDTPSTGILHAGDVILAIGGYDTTTMTHFEASQLIRDHYNTIQLTVQTGCEPIKSRPLIKASPGTAFTYNG